MIIRNKSKRYTVIPSALLEDERLTWEAKGILAYLLSKPDTWELKPAHLISAGNFGRQKIYEILRELQEAGYAFYRRKHDGHVEWEIYDTAREEDPRDEKKHKATHRDEEPNEALPNEALPNEALPNEALPNEALPNEANHHVLVNTERTVNTESIVTTDSYPVPPARVCKENSQPQPDNPLGLQSLCEPKTPRDWAQCFIQRCGYRIDQAITPKSMAMFRQWLADGVTLEDVEDAAAAAEAKLGGYPSNPTYYRGFVAEVVSEKQRAKENPVSFGNQPGSIRKSPTSKRMLADDNFDNKRYVGTPEEEIWWLQ